jgi:hypothetical protein
MGTTRYTTTRVLNILDHLGYIPITSNYSQLLYTSIKKALEKNFDQQFAAVLVEKLCSMTGLTEKELLTNYDLFEKSLYSLRDSKKFLDIVVHWVKVELLTEAVLKDSNITVEQILDPKLTINDILLHISGEQVYEFIRTLPAHKHIAFFYSSEESRDKALRAFFDPVTTKGAPTSLISLKPVIKDATYSKNLNLNSNMLYTQIFSSLDKSEIKNRLFDWIYSVHSSSSLGTSENGKMALSQEEQDDGGTGLGEKQTEDEMKQQDPHTATRIATDDDTWFFRNGFKDEILITEESVGRCVKDNISIMCMFDIPKVTDEESLRRLVRSHSHVVLDYPYMVYAEAGEVS